MAVGLFLLPVIVGLAGTLAPAFGYLPAIGAGRLSLEPWRALFGWPGFGSALRLTLTSGIVASLTSLIAALSLVAMTYRRPIFLRLQGLLTPILASPHAAIALGLAFVLAPSGWLVRIISPELTGWTRPPADLVTIRDAHGLALAVGLIVKEVPYLLIMIAAALGQIPAAQLADTARSMGYRPATAFLKVILPRIWPQIRLPFYAALSYSLSVVDQAIVLAPGSPPPLAVLATRWFADFDLNMYPPAAAAALLQFAIVLAGIGTCYIIERLCKHLGQRWVERGARTGPFEIMSFAGSGIAILAALLGAAALASLLIWSFTGFWTFPDALPSNWSLTGWTTASMDMGAPLRSTLIIAGLSSAIALCLSVACLENELRNGSGSGRGALWLVFVPLLVPQIAFLFGVQVALVRAGLDGTIIAVVWTHLIFVFPYVFLSIGDPWRALDPRYARSAASLGAGPFRILLTVKLPMMLVPLLLAFAVGIAVSVAQYLPTLFAGGGRIATLTTEALTLSSGGDRRIVSAYGFVQAAVPLLAFLMALGIPRFVRRISMGGVQA